MYQVPYWQEEFWLKW